MSRLAAFAACSVGLGLTACMPVINHGPSVVEGVSTGLSLSMPGGPKFTRGDWGGTPLMYGPFGFNLGHGTRSKSPGGGAFQAGVHIPVTTVLVPQGIGELAQADVYYQLPTRITGSAAAGAGMNVSADYLMPYLQFGKIDERRNGLYTTQGVLFAHGNADNASSADPTVAWMPTIAYQAGGARQTFHFFTSAALVLKRNDCEYCSPQPNYTVTAGMQIQVHRKQ